MIKMNSPGEFDFLRFCAGFLSMIEMKREKPSEVEGFSLRKLKLFMNALFLCDHLQAHDFDTIMRLIW